MSCSLKVGNSLGLFDGHTFPWIVSLYDLRVICEHMEGPAYLIQYIHRRREFFKISRFIFDDELDLLAYYLKYNLRLDDLLKKYRDKPGYLKLPAEGQIFNDFYENTGKTTSSRQRLKHKSNSQVKELVAALEESQLENSIDAAVQILEFSATTRKKLFELKDILKKRYRKDKMVHDSRFGGDEDDGSWMFSYWVGPDNSNSIDFFEQTVVAQFRSTFVADFFAIYDSGNSGYHFKKIIHFSRVKQ